MQTNALPALGFIGTGVMGRSMAHHLLKAGYPLHIHNRTKAKAESLIAAGATWHSHPQTIPTQAKVIITMLGYPKDVAEVYAGPEGLLQQASPQSLLIDCTTSDPSLAKDLACQAEKRQITLLDAPVSGGDLGAREAKLSIMVGGCRQGFDQAQPIFNHLGQTIIHQGPPGSGQHTKMVNQIAIAAGMVAVAEAMAYAQDSGLNYDQLMASISSGAAASWSLSHLGPRMVQKNWAPGFYVKHFIKDMRIAQSSAQAMGLETPGLNLALSLYEKLAEQGGDNDGTQAIAKLFQ